MSSRISVLLVLVHAVLGGPVVPASADDAESYHGFNCWSLAESEGRDPNQQWMTGYVVIGPVVGADIFAASEQGKPPALSPHPSTVKSTVKCWIQVNNPDAHEPPEADLECYASTPATVVFDVCLVEYSAVSTDTRYLCHAVDNDHRDARVKGCATLKYARADAGVVIEYTRLSDSVIRSSIVEG